MKIWQQANPVVPKIPSNKASNYNNKFDNMATKPKKVHAQAREIACQSGTVAEKTHNSETGIAESMEGREVSSEGQAGLTSQNTSEGWKSKTEEILAALRRQEVERKLELEQFEIECRKKREKWDAEWRRMFDSCLGQESHALCRKRYHEARLVSTELLFLVLLMSRHI